jgi:hypothetical protein
MATAMSGTNILSAWTEAETKAAVKRLMKPGWHGHFYPVQLTSRRYAKYVGGAPASSEQLAKVISYPSTLFQ